MYVNDLVAVGIGDNGDEDRRDLLVWMQGGSRRRAKPNQVVAGERVEAL
jgi:hypothetical protein